MTTITAATRTTMDTPTATTMVMRATITTTVRLPTAWGAHSPSESR